MGQNLNFDIWSIEVALHFDLKTYTPPIGDIQLHIVVVAYGGSSSGDVTIGPMLATSSEIDHQIDTMIKELESVRRRAKNKLNQSKSC